MKAIKSILVALFISAASITLANAQTRFHVSVNAPGVHVSAGNYYPYYHRAYYEPAYYPTYERVYYPVHRVYYTPVHRHYVVYRRPVYHHVYYSHHYNHGHHYGHMVSHHAHYRH